LSRIFIALRGSSTAMRARFLPVVVTAYALHLVLPPSSCCPFCCSFCCLCTVLQFSLFYHAVDVGQDARTLRDVAFFAVLVVSNVTVLAGAGYLVYLCFCCRNRGVRPLRRVARWQLSENTENCSRRLACGRCVAPATMRWAAGAERARRAAACSLLRCWGGGMAAFVLRRRAEKGLSSGSSVGRADDMSAAALNMFVWYTIHPRGFCSPPPATVPVAGCSQRHSLPPFRYAFSAFLFALVQMGCGIYLCCSTTL